MLQAVQRLELAPRLLAAPRGAGSRPVLLLMEAAPGAPPDWTDEGALEGSMRAIAELHRRTARPDGTVLCHGDLHRANLLWDGRRATLLDWALARRERPLWDLARFWPWATAAGPRQGGTGPTCALSPGCDLPTGEAALTALRVYHRAGPLAHLSWPEFQVQHRAAARTLLVAERDRHQAAARKAPANLRPWIQEQARIAEDALQIVPRRC
jgi:aminoglycoside phosphotransferase (APT) family kinase protein